MHRSPVGLIVMAFVLVPAAATTTPPPPAVPGPPIAAYDRSSPPPVIDGAIGVGEWPYTPQIVVDNTYPATYVRPTYVTFVNDTDHLWVLVDAPGDTSDDSDCDECMMIFAPDGGGAVEVSLYLVLGQLAQVKPAGVAAAIGFGPSPNSATNHRIYEFQIPRSTIGATPEATMRFCSPAFFKTCGAVPFHGSMPYDGTTGNDNIWPPGDGFVYGDRDTWSVFDLQEHEPIPVLGIAGRALMVALLAAAAALALTRRSV